MIKDQDAEFHVTDSDPTWAETNFFGFFNAEHKLNVGVYALFRPNLGVVSSTICMNSGRAVAPWEADCPAASAASGPASRSADHRSVAIRGRVPRTERSRGTP